MRTSLLTGLLGAALAVAPAFAAPAKKPARTPKPPPVLTVEAPLAVVRVNGQVVPQAIAMKAMTPAEAEANAIWNLRAGLNVAALQCQYSPYLATVKTYNDLLKHHSAELAAAQATMLGHFKRYDGTRALNSFDQYTTKTYNSFSTLDAQFAFCVASAGAGRGALFVVKGALGKYALVQTPILRLSLIPPGPRYSFASLVPVPLPPVEG